MKEETDKLREGILKGAHHIFSENDLKELRENAERIGKYIETADNLLERTLHCDGYYSEKVCSSRGEFDQTDHFKVPRRICTTQGQCPLYDYDLCRHCIEVKRFLRTKDRPRSGRIIRK